MRIQANTALGNSLIRQGRLKDKAEAVAAVDSAVRAQGQTLDPLLRVLQSAQDRAVLAGDSVAGRRLANEALKRFDWRKMPEADRSYGDWASALISMGMMSEAKEMIDLLGKRFAQGNSRQDGRWLAFVRGELAVREGRSQEGIRGLQEAVSAYPEWGIGVYGFPLAMALAKSQKPDSAIAVFERFLASPVGAHVRGSGPLFDAVAFERLGSLYEDKGNKTKALQNYETLLALWKNADPELQPLVRDLRARVERLRRGTG